MEVGAATDWIERWYHDIVPLEVWNLIEERRDKHSICFAVLRVLVPDVSEVSGHGKGLDIVLVSVFIWHLDCGSISKHHEEQLGQILAKEVLHHDLAVLQTCWTPDTNIIVLLFFHEHALIHFI